MDAKPSLDVLVMGATGRFGEIVHELLSRGHRVRAASRAAHDRQGRSLAELGAEVVYADFGDPDSLRCAAHGVDAVFASGTAHRSGPDGEARHGQNLADALADVDVRHLVFVSGAGADVRSAVPVFRAKGVVEQHIAARGLPATLLAPVYLMDNLFNRWNLSALRAGIVPTPIPPSSRLQQVALSDIVSLAVVAIERPAEFTGKRIEIASDELTGHEAAAVLSAVGGRRLVASRLSRDGLPPGLVALFEHLEHEPGAVDIASLRRRYPEVGWRRFNEWAVGRRAQLAQLSAAA